MSIPSTFVCSISGTVPVEPVVSRSSGLLFERRLIEKHLELAGNTCPITQQPMTKDDLLSVHSAVKAGSASPANGVSGNEVVKPRPPSATSIPGLLAMLQGEWDACMLETFHLKQQLESLKQDLAHSLYKEDAANRVIARLIKERDVARAALLQTQQNVMNAPAPAQSAAPMEVEEGKKAALAPGELSESVVSLLTSTAASLSKTRKATVKEAAAAAATPQDLQAMKVQDKSHPLHATTNPGILAVDINKNNQNLILTGGNDGQALLFNRSTGKISSHIKGHQSAVTAVKFHPTRDLLFTASMDFTANIWSNDGSGKYNVAHHLSGAKDALVGLALHPSGELVATAAKDGSWALYDVAEGRELNRLHADVPFSTVSFHPDGVILACGSGSDKSGSMLIYDVKSAKMAAKLEGQHTSAGGISAFAFSENGFHCASADASGVIKLWDLRKLANFHTITAAPIEGDKAGVRVSSLSFDDSASYLGAAIGSRVSVYSKQWEEVVSFHEHKDRVTAMAWGSQARTMVSVSMDRNLKVWA